MQDKHEPRADFVERLEWRLSSEVRRRNRAVPGPWIPRSPVKAFLAITALVVVSMGIGGAVVATAYQTGSNERRDLLAAGLEQRIELARQRVALAKDTLQMTERQVAVGLGQPNAIVEGRALVVEAEAQLKSLDLQVQEVRLTGREPLDQISAPLVSGRDFVSQRLQIDMSVPQASLELEQARLGAAQARWAVGLANRIDVEVARSHTIEMESAIEAIRTKLEIRQKFLKGEISAAEAGLRALEAEAQARHRALVPKVELAKKQADELRARVAVGTGQHVDLAEATLRLLKLQAELGAAELDLAVIQRRLQQPEERR